MIYYGTLYDMRHRERTYTSEEKQLKEAYEWLKNHPTTKTVVNCSKYVDYKQVKNTSLSWQIVDGKRQIVFCSGPNSYYLLKSDGSKGKKVKMELLENSRGLIYKQVFFTN